MYYIKLIYLNRGGSNCFADYARDINENICDYGAKMHWTWNPIIISKKQFQNTSSIQTRRCFVFSRYIDFAIKLNVDLSTPSILKKNNPTI